MKKILFDVTPLAEGRNNKIDRTGIYFCTRNILKELSRREDISIDFYCAPKVLSVAEYELQDIINADINIINKKQLSMMLSKLWCLISKKRIWYKTNKKIFLNDVFSVLEIIFEHIALVFDNYSDVKLNKYKFYLSTKYQAPKKIYKYEGLQKFIILHDAIFIFHPEFFYVKLMKFRKLWIQYLIETMNNEEVYLTNSSYTKKDFLKCCPSINKENFKVVYHACSESFKLCTDSTEIMRVKNKYGIDVDKKYLFSLCTIEPRKNIVRIVRSFIKFVQKNNIEDMVMVLGGKAWNNFAQIFEKEAGIDLNSNNNVIRIGYVDDGDLPILYSGAEWFVYTSQYEGFGVPPLEAMSCGCPVIVSNNSSLPEVVGEAGLLIDWDSDEQHVEAYEKYYYNCELREKNREKGLIQAQKFSWENFVDSTLKIAEGIK